LIVRVATGSPAAKAGLKEGDVITKLAGIETNTVADLRSTVDQKKIGESVEVLFSRNGKELNTNVVFSDVPSEQ
jgi:serine protease Do